MEKTIKSLNKNWWYRLLKVTYIFFFFLALLVSFLLTSSFLSQQTISDESFVKVGQTIKQQYTDEYGQYSDQEIGKRVYEKRYDEWLKYRDLVIYEDKFSMLEKNIYYILTFFIVALFFELVKRAFYYISLGSVNPKKK